MIILLPALVGLILWNKLPDSIATHWDINGTADGFSSKRFAVLVFPLIFAAVQTAVFFVTKEDPRNEAVSEKINSMVLWLLPCVSLYTSSSVYATALGMKINTAQITMIMVGAMFIVIGNYLPKIRHNYTIGIKVPWTLNDEENWNATHRMAGAVWVLCGIAMIVMGFTGANWTGLALVIACATMIPMSYSWYYYKTHTAGKAGE